MIEMRITALLNEILIAKLTNKSKRVIQKLQQRLDKIRLN